MRRTCTSIAAWSPEVAAERVKFALDMGSDLAELRLDYIEPGRVLDAVRSVKGHMDHLILTIRTPEEGGLWLGNERDRIQLLRHLADFRPYLLDIEMRTIEQNAGIMEDLNTEVLVSWHNKWTPRMEYLRSLKETMSYWGTVVKMVARAEDTYDRDNLMDLCDSYTIAFSPGKKWRATRLHCVDRGSPFTYCHNMDPLEPGQMHLSHMQARCKLCGEDGV